MTDWKVRQQIYHQVFSSSGFDDDLENEVIEFDDDSNVIIQKALEYPVKQTATLYYPGKSYSIAIIYALLLKRHFGVDIYRSLKDPELLFGNDPYFVTYDQDEETYDAILKSFPVHYLEEPCLGCENFQLTHDYFLKEFLLHEETRKYVSS